MQFPEEIINNKHFHNRNITSNFVRCDGLLYGAKQAPRRFAEAQTANLEKVGFVQSQVDPCLYHFWEESKGAWIMVLVYVDDVVVIADNTAQVDWVYEQIRTDFEVDDMGPIDFYLGMKFTRDWERGTFRVDQSSFIEKIINSHPVFGLNMTSNPSPLPYTAKLVLTKEQMPGVGEPRHENASSYRSCLAACLYASRMTRPDIAFAVSRLGRFGHNPGEAHVAELKRLLRYLIGTKDRGLLYTKTGSAVFQAFADADYATDVDTRKSVSGYVIMMFGAALSWQATLQESVSLSTAEAELIALSKCTQETIFLRRILVEIFGRDEDDAHPVDIEVPMDGVRADSGWTWDPAQPSLSYCDNAAALLIANNDGTTKRLKHVAVREFFCRDKVSTGDIRVVRVPSAANPADMLTKTQNQPIFRRHSATVTGESPVDDF